VLCMDIDADPCLYSGCGMTKGRFGSQKGIVVLNFFVGAVGWGPKDFWVYLLFLVVRTGGDSVAVFSWEKLAFFGGMQCAAL
jgi:hypothetical protein